MNETALLRTNRFLHEPAVHHQQCLWNAPAEECRFISFISSEDSKKIPHPAFSLSFRFFKSVSASPVRIGCDNERIVKLLCLHGFHVHMAEQRHLASGRIIKLVF